MVFWILHWFNICWCRGHGKCVEFMKKFNIPLMLLGGGGYTVRNVARLWAYETSICCEEDLANELPYTEYFEYFSPDFTLHPEVNPRMENANSSAYLQAIVETIERQLDLLAGAPSVQMHDVPDGFHGFMKNRPKPEEDPDKKPQLMDFLKTEHNGEYYDGESDQDGEEEPETWSKTIKNFTSVPWTSTTRTVRKVSQLSQF